MSKRKESSYAGQRKQVRLLELKSVDMVETGDALEFTYKDRTFKAQVGLTGQIVANRHAAHKSQPPNDSKSYYVAPSNFTNDCVSVYWHDYAGSSEVREECHTNPSGYERVKHVKSGKTLNQLRDDYMRLHVVAARNSKQTSPANDVRSPSNIVDVIDSRSSSSEVPKRRRLTIDEDYTLIDYSDDTELVTKTADDVGTDIASLLADGATTIATLRASGRGRGYKEIAHVLQRKLTRRSRALRTLMHYVEKFQQDNTLGSVAAKEAAQMIGAFVDATVAVEEQEVLPTSNECESDLASDEPIQPRFNVAELDGLLRKSLAGTYKQ